MSVGKIYAYIIPILIGSLDSSYAAALQAHVAKLVTTAPAGGDKEAYFLNISEQVRDLLLYGLFKNDKVFIYSSHLSNIYIARFLLFLE